MSALNLPPRREPEHSHERNLTVAGPTPERPGQQRLSGGWAERGPNEAEVPAALIVCCRQGEPGG